MNRVAASFAIVTFAIGLVGCTKARQSTPNAEGANGVFQNAGLHDLSKREYTIDPPDQILIKAPQIKELDNVQLPVRDTGTIVAPLIGEVKVVGLTPEQARQEIILRVTKFYVNPDIRIDVVAASKFYYVFWFGAQKQGKFPYTGRVTVVSAVADAGFTSEGWPQQVLLSRPARGNQPAATAVVDFTKVMDWGDLRQNYLVEEGDIIEIPYSPLASWNEKLTRLIGPLAGTASLATTPANVVSSLNTNR